MITMPTNWNLTVTLTIKVQALQQNLLNLRNFYVREQLKNRCYRINNLLEKAWNDRRNVTVTGKMYSSDYTVSYS